MTSWNITLQRELIKQRCLCFLLRSQHRQSSRSLEELNQQFVPRSSCLDQGRVFQQNRPNIGLAEWIDENARFPDSMVDCIVPATGKAELSFVQNLGIDDAAPLTHENYRQWVIEDQFCAGRPPWDQAGATITDNVHAYESMKIRILNAGHQVLANAGETLGIDTIADCMANSIIAAFFHKVQVDEILPYVDGVAEISSLNYLALIEKRFANPKIRDTTRGI